ncbi:MULTISPECIES: hypothetical protein [unclassified Streptococcus]|uniref:hypothetical protein n=1 Tax=unclassified Streptococcus TaxID=2608887 RepID=UPI0018A8D0AB|nr:MULTISPECIES: hypothetical protein [unclassified Streptococcus]MBF8969812.1 hypothetical protein [Streptococcus sp. NLN76]MBG9366701.1 hypothetical protein [Streptococcus sp. NLN64]
MKNIIRFSIIECISMLLLYLLGISVGFSLTKIALLALLNFSYQLLAMIMVSRTSSVVLPLKQVFQNLMNYIKYTIVIPVLIVFLLIIQMKTMSIELRFIFLSLLIMVYTIGSIFSLSPTFKRKKLLGKW